MTLFELNELLRGIPAERLKEIRVEYLDTSDTNQIGEDCFNAAAKINLTIEQIGPDEYAQALRFS